MNNDTSTFESIFYAQDAKAVRVPDYQRAFAWEDKQIDLFIEDLKKYQKIPNNYYFGHFIVEMTDAGWDLVDGQQRITTFVLFLIICRLLSPDSHPAYSLIDRFSTVSYDNNNLNLIITHLAGLPELSHNINLKRDISNECITAAFSTKGDTLTLSLKRMVWALLRFYQKFDKDELDRTAIDTYINVVMSANCSHHPAQNKSVAVNVFEMHNTRGIPLSTIEIVKAKLMQFVYENGGELRENKVSEIQNQFGAIFQMEELLSAKTFRGEMSLEHLLGLHLRVVDDGSKRELQDLNRPGANAEAILKYLDNKLHFEDWENKTPKNPDVGVKYALEMTAEFRKSVWIVSEFLPAWDEGKSLVGDVLILERDLSCQFFLLACRRDEADKGKGNGKLDDEILTLWERLLFTRDFHGKYHNLRGARDNFPELFSEFFQENKSLKDIINGYLADGFRYDDHTVGLQGIVREFLELNRNQIFNNAFYWWKHKMIYAIYKYEKLISGRIRDVVKSGISVEHILPQNWYWIREEPSVDTLKSMDDNAWKMFHEAIDACINGIGNLLLITPNENASASNDHPKNKCYEQLCSGGSYEEHNNNRGRWEDPQKWRHIIEERGEKIYQCMLDNLVGVS